MKGGTLTIPSLADRTGHALPAPHPELVWVPVDDRFVVARRGHHGAHVLDVPAAAVMELLEARPTYDGLLRRLAGLTGADPTRIDADLARLLDRLQDSALLEGPGDRGTPPTSQDRVWPLPRTACQASFDAWAVWSPVVPVQVGRHVLGLRTDDDEVAAGLCGLVGVEEADGVSVPAHLTLETAPRGGGPHGARPLARLSWGCQTVATARHWRDLVPVLAAWVQVVGQVDGDEVLGVVGTAVRTRDTCVVVPASWTGVSARRRLARYGEPLPGPVVAVSADTVEVLDGDRPLRVVGWVGGSPGNSTATAVADAYARMAPLPVRPQKVLVALRDLLQRTPVLEDGAPDAPGVWFQECSHGMRRD